VHFDRRESTVMALAANASELVPRNPRLVSMG
jgi:hypothetical protein